MPQFNEKNNDTKDYSEQLEFLNSEPYYASKKIVNESSDFPVRRTGSYRHKKSTGPNTSKTGLDLAGGRPGVQVNKSRA